MSLMASDSTSATRSATASGGSGHRLVPLVPHSQSEALHTALTRARDQHTAHAAGCDPRGMSSLLVFEPDGNDARLVFQLHLAPTNDEPPSVS